MKNKFFSLALGALIALPITTSAVAQDNAPSPQNQGPGARGSHQMDPDRMLQRLTRELDLTADQQAQIKPLLVDHQQKVQALMQDQSGSQEDRHAKMKDMGEDLHSKIAALLNDQQKQKFLAMQQRMHPGGESGPPPAPPQ
jgi:Spy/CpxP family protein refolding chaperone